jgi:replicative DNA helicase
MVRGLMRERIDPPCPQPCNERTMAANQNTAVIPPQNLEAEESVLGAMMVSEAAIEPVILDVRLHSEDFYRPRHRTVFEAIIRLREQNGAVDALTVSEGLAQHGELEEVGGKDFVASLAARVPAAGNARHYARIVKQNALMRRLDAAAKTIVQSVADRDGEPSELVEQAERLLFQVAHEEQASDFKSLEDVLHSEWDRLQLLHENKAELIGTPSGFKELDDKTGGFQRNNLVVIAARPSMGKSALVCNMAENAALRHGKTVALFSLEMSESELAQRFLASQGRISSDRLRKGTVSNSDWPKVVEANNRLAEAPLWIDDSSDLGLLELRAKARRLAAQERGAGRELGLVIVDYIQLIRADDPRANRVEQVSQFSRGLKLLSGELGVPVIAVSQLSRAPEQRPDKRPILSDLRESGAIEQDADVVMFLYRDEYYNPESEDQGVAELHLAKHRNGPIGTVKLVFLSHYPKFANMTKGEQPIQQPAGEGPPLPQIPDADSAAEEG